MSTTSRISFSENPDDPLTRVLEEECAQETPEERRERLEREERARQRSHEIDAELEAERKKIESEGFLSILLLGQSESGKSTTLKQFQVLAEPGHFDSQRQAWRDAVYLNFTRMTRIMLALTARYLGSEETREKYNLVPGFREKSMRFKELKLRLSPLLRTERDIIKAMGFDKEDFIPSSIQPEFLDVDPQPEYFFSSNKSWMKKPLGQGDKRKGKAVIGDAYEDPSDYIVALAPDVKEVWEMDVVKEALECCRVRLEEQGGFFLNEIDRISEPDYLPTDDDILRCRIKTLGVSAHNIPTGRRNPLLDGKTLRIYDVGGARTQRARWIPYFEKLNLIVFLLPISAFDQYLEEDPHVNRLQDSLDLWKTIVTDPVLTNVPIALLLNKCDLAKAKLARGIEIKKFITSYEGPNTFEGLAEYIRPRLQKICVQANPKRTLYIYYTVVSDSVAAVSTVRSLEDMLVRHSISDIYSPDTQTGTGFAFV